ncbi:hypothetical protein DSO57_1024379 [Entomophthora muscae]|uniref:Uncharacterized protein n=1 Tax=Entomophthora muscae TaxID=34485 RepID=A0ACC2RTK9_9FUNG|nr:hypothetical protein DSO57_1024379 [Entomophthora muscae]
MQDYLLLCCLSPSTGLVCLCLFGITTCTFFKTLLVTLLEGLFTIAVTLRRQPFLNLLSNSVEGNVADPELIRRKVVHLGIKQWNNCAVALLHPIFSRDKDV